MLRRKLKLGLLVAALLVSVAAWAQDPKTPKEPAIPPPAAGDPDVCRGEPAPVEDPTQVTFCWNPADAEELPPDGAKKPAKPPYIKDPKPKTPGAPPPGPKGPASGSKGTAFRPK